MAESPLAACGTYNRWTSNKHGPSQLGVLLEAFHAPGQKPPHFKDSRRQRIPHFSARGRPPGAPSRCTSPVGVLALQAPTSMLRSMPSTPADAARPGKQSVRELLASSVMLLVSRPRVSGSHNSSSSGFPYLSLQPEAPQSRMPPPIA